MSYTSRDIRHFIKAGITLGVDVKNHEARVAVAFTNRKEPCYSRPAARTHINLRFDADDSTLFSLGLSRNVVRFPYVGNMPRREILEPMVEALKEQLEKRERTHRYEGSVVEMRKIISRKAAVAVALQHSSISG